MMNEVFGEENFVASIIWEKKFAPSNDAKWFSDNHDYVLVYSKNKMEWRPNLLNRDERALKRYKNPDNDHRGLWVSGDMTVKTYNAKYDFEIATPSGRKVNPPEGICWRFSKEKFQDLILKTKLKWNEHYKIGNYFLQNIHLIKEKLLERHYLLKKVSQQVKINIY